MIIVLVFFLGGNMMITRTIDMGPITFQQCAHYGELQSVRLHPQAVSWHCTKREDHHSWQK